jgi:hypothetical protein
MSWPPPSALSLGLLAAWLCAPLACAAPVLDQLALARDVICSFRKSGPVPVPPPLHTRDDDLMVIIEGIGVDPETANVTSSRAVGPRPARVYASDASDGRVHIVEDVHDSVIVTTVLDCETWKISGETRKCTRFAAVIAWHFDRAVHTNPDRTFLGLPGSSFTGHCEPWNLE